MLVFQAWSLNDFFRACCLRTICMVCHIFEQNTYRSTTKLCIQLVEHNTFVWYWLAWLPLLWIWGWTMSTWYEFDMIWICLDYKCKTVTVVQLNIRSVGVTKSAELQKYLHSGWSFITSKGLLFSERCNSLIFHTILNSVKYVVNM